MSRVQINTYACKLRLLQYGLVDEAGAIDTMGAGKGDKKKGVKDQDDSESEVEDDEDLISRRNAYVKRCIRVAQTGGKLKGIMAGSKNPIAAEQRRATVKEFFKDVGSVKKCTSCSGYAIRPSFLLQIYCSSSFLTLSTVFHQAIEETDTRRSSGRPCQRSPGLP